MLNVLFFIPNLRDGGAEKVLVNLVNNMDKSKFNVTIKTIFDEGVNKQFINKDVKFSGKLPKVFRGNVPIMKLFTPRQLYRFFIKERYDIVVAYLEGPSTRIIAGCPYIDSKKVAWVHGEQHTMDCAAASFRCENEIRECYEKFDKIIAVSNNVKEDMQSIFSFNDIPLDVLYNTNESSKIIELSGENVQQEIFSDKEIKLISVGRINPVKGFDRLADIHIRLREAGYPVHTYILGVGQQRDEIEKYIKTKGYEDSFTFLGYNTNPYKYVSKCDIFVCTSRAEGFSTAATEALIVGTPVCTVEVSGMKEMLGENNEYGIVTENDDEALYQGIKSLLDDSELLAHYRQQAQIRGKDFDTENTVKAVEEMLLTLTGK